MSTATRERASIGPEGPAPGRISPIPGAPNLGVIVDAAAGLVPLLREQAGATEVERRLPATTNDLFHEAGFYRLMQPARFGGYEYGFSALLDVISELGRGCGAAAWAGSLGAIHQWLLALFPPEAQDEVWGGDAAALMCGSYAPVGVAEAVDGGYLVSGEWRFASNVDNSTWAVIGTGFPATDDEPASAGFLVVPRSDWDIVDDWHVAGQAGTGSKTVRIAEPTFVPGHRRLTFTEAGSGRPPGMAVNTNALYRISFLSAIPICLVAPLLGNAQGAIDCFVYGATDRVTRGGVGGAGNPVSQFAHVQSRLAEAAAAVDAARLVLDRDTAAVEWAATTGAEIDVAMRIRSRRGHGYAAKLCQGAVTGLLANVGAGGLALDQPMQRIWRDGTMMAHHITLNWDAVSTMVGQHMLGLEPRGAY